MEWSRILELAVGLILASGVVAKVSRPAGFISALRRYEFLPARAVPAVAMSTLAAEAIVGVLLLTGVSPAPALGAAALLFGVFSFVGWREVSKTGGGPGADCGCLGDVLRLRHSLGAVILNLVVGGACLVGVATVVGGGRADAAPARELWLILALSLLLTAMYWVAHYAITVISELETQSEEQGEQI